MTTRANGEGIVPGWTWSTLGECFKWSSGGTPSSSNAAYYGGDIPWVVIGDLNDGTITRTRNTITPAGFQASSAKWVREGSVLVAMYGSIGKLAIAGVPLTTNQAIAFTHPSPIEPRYLFYYLASIREELVGAGKGGTQQNISQTVLKGIPFPLAPLSEQRRIVAALEEHLSELVAAVAGLERARANLRRYRAAILRSACVGELVSDVEANVALRHDAAEAPSLVRTGPSVAPDEGNVGSLPQDWRVVSLDALASRITSGSRDWSKYYDRGTGTFIMAQNVRPGRLDLSFRQAVDPPPNDRDRERSQVREGDVLVTIVGANTGDVCLVPSELPEHFVCQSVALVRPHCAEVGRWIAMYLNSPENGRRQFEKYMYGQGRPHLSFDQLRSVAVPLPPLSVQRAILDEVDRRMATVDRSGHDLDTQLLRANRLRQSILKHAFEGKLVPQDPNDEPASVLLDRIRAERATNSPRAPKSRPKAKTSRKASHR